MKKIIFIILVIIAMILTVYSFFHNIGQIVTNDVQSNAVSDEEVSIEESMERPKILDVYEIKNSFENTIENINLKNNQEQKENDERQTKKVIDEWNLLLVNFENELPENFTVELAKLDNGKEIDSRIIEHLNQMFSDMKNDGVGNIWVQSSYRDVEYQKKLYNKKIKEYLNKGLSEDEAILLTSRAINKPGTSEHSTGLAVDFNNVKHSFADTKEYEWLIQNAENYGFILRYRDDKEEITKVEYEPWHWRYVGEEHAKKINEMEMCLEEYIEYLNNN